VSGVFLLAIQELSPQLHAWQALQRLRLRVKTNNARSLARIV
jgi:hypothetical protein